MLHVLEGFPEIKTACIFGSRSQDRAKSGSDIDLAVSAPQLSFERFLTLRRMLNDALLHQVDVLHLEKVSNPRLKASILQTGQQIYPRL